MGVKIIKPGIKPSERVYEATCRTCECVFEFAVSDAKYHHDKRDGDFLSIGCPTCHATYMRNANG